MKTSLFLLLLLFSFYLYPQDVFNPYIDYAGQSFGVLDRQYYKFNNQDQITGYYNGEYEISMDYLPWGNQRLIDSYYSSTTGIVPHLDLSNFTLTYNIELVSFPFSLDCAFPNLADVDGGCAGSLSRDFNVPPDSYFPNGIFNYWLYPYSYANKTSKLWNLTGEKDFKYSQSGNPPPPAITDNLSNANTIVSAIFTGSGAADDSRDVFPHSILKHTISIRCGSQINDPIINSFSFYVDLTRGIFREYPFCANSTAATQDAYDLIIRPEFIPPTDYQYNNSDVANCTYFRNNLLYNCANPDEEGMTINYYRKHPTNYILI